MYLKSKLFSVIPRIVLKWLLALVPAACLAWGPQGHRVAGELTGPLLNPDTAAAVRALVGDESLGEASTWADRMRGNPSPFWQETSKPFHYVTVPPGRRYQDVGAPPKGDGVTALAEFRAILEDPDASRAHKQLALRFSLHIVQDLHQPLHVGNGGDRGGNGVNVSLDGERTNLHRVWDSAVISHARRSDDAWIRRLEPTPAQVQAWSTPDPLAWIEESATLRERIYPAGKRIDEDYLDQWLPATELRLQQSAVRGAAYLNSITFR